MSNSQPSRKREHETDESEDNSDIKVLTAKSASATVKKKKSGPEVKQRYKKDYHGTWPFLGPSTKGDYHVFCKLCKKDFSCSHSGQYDCRKHINFQVHKNIAEQASTSGNVKAFFKFHEKKKKSHFLVWDYIFLLVEVLQILLGEKQVCYSNNNIYLWLWLSMTVISKTSRKLLPAVNFFIL